MGWRFCRFYGYLADSPLGFGKIQSVNMTPFAPLHFQFDLLHLPVKRDSFRPFNESS